MALETQGINIHVCLSTCLTVSTGQENLTNTVAIFQTEQEYKNTMCNGLDMEQPRSFSFFSLDVVAEVQ